jgi:hypothetical protein
LAAPPTGNDVTFADNVIAGAVMAPVVAVVVIPTARETGMLIAFVLLVRATPLMAVVIVLDSTAFAGATEVKTPKPKAATATSAMRLKVVFVDIFFLSFSREQEFPVLGFG